LGEGACKVIEAEISDLREGVERNFFRKMFLDEFDYAFLLPCQQAAPGGPGRGGVRSFQSEQLVRYGHGRFPRPASLAGCMAMMVESGRQQSRHYRLQLKDLVRLLGA
jgi:hypothetical protein